MKKFTSALLAVTAFSATVAMAEAPVASATGFYLGANAGAANTNVKYSYNNNNTLATVGASSATTIASGKQQNYKAETGSSAPIFGAFAGYGMQVNKMYFGGELYAGFDSSKLTPMDDSATGSAGGYFKTTVQRKNFFGFAPRAGFFITPTTMAYVRLGVEFGKWEVKVDPNFATIDASAGVTSNQKAASRKQFKNSKNKASFAPGFGFEVFMTKNLFMRAEYSYLFGPSIDVNQNIDGYNADVFAGTTLTHKTKITQHALKVGVGYKF